MAVEKRFAICYVSLPALALVCIASFVDYVICKCGICVSDNENCELDFYENRCRVFLLNLILEVFYIFHRAK